MNKPFFSVVIPCYNSSLTIERVLDSLVNQNFDPMEVIIADDRSTDDTLEKARRYASRLHMVFVSVPEQTAHSPGNTKQVGYEAATGRWITFIDHDDYFLAGSFRKVYDYIEQFKPEVYVATTFSERDKNGKILKQYTLIDHPDDFMHGKWYNLDYCRERDIRFPVDLTSEDSYWNILISSWWVHEKKKKHFFSYLPFDTYVWVAEENSYSRKQLQDNPHDYIEKHLRDLIQVKEVYIDFYNKWPEDHVFFYDLILGTIINNYYFFQTAIYLQGTDFLKENFHYFKEDLEKIVVTLDVTIQEIINVFYNPINACQVNLFRQNIIGNLYHNSIIELFSFQEFMEFFQ